jgi:DNA repair protein RadC
MMRYEYKLKTVQVACASDLETPAYGPAGDPEVAADVVMSILRKQDHGSEHFLILALDGRHRVNGFKVHSSGTRNQAPVDSAAIFRTALALDAAGIILAHNHPSGQLEPSRDDLDLTKRLVQAGNVVGVGVWDHIITTGPTPFDDRWLSLRRSRPGLFGGAV